MDLDYNRSLNLCKFPEKLPAAIVYGCGTIGSYLAVVLNKIPWQSLILVDHDKVERVNIPYQDFYMNDTGLNKAEVVADSLDFYDKRMDEGPEAKPYKCENIMEGLVAEHPQAYHFGCVDDLESKAFIVEHLDPGSIWIDARAAGVQVEVSLTLISDIPMRKQIAKFLYDQAERVENLPCGYRNVIENGPWSTALIVTLLRHWFNEQLQHKVFVNHEDLVLTRTMGGAYCL